MGYRIGEVFQNDLSGQWTNNTRYTFENNPLGLPVSSVQQKWVNNAWTNNYYDRMWYNPLGMNTESISQAWQNNAWENTNRVTTSWHSNYNPYEMVYYNWLNNIWQAQMRFNYQYNTAGKPTTMQMDTWYNNTWNPSHRIQYGYNAQNHPQSTVTEHYENPNWVPDYRTTYECNPQGNITVSVEEDYDGGSWFNSSRNYYTYDAGGMTIEELYQVWDLSAWRNSTKLNFDRRPTGGINTFQTFQFSNGQWVPDEKSEYTYDANGNGAAGAGFKWQSSTWVPNNMYLEMWHQSPHQYDEGYWGTTYNALYGSFTDIHDPGTVPSEFRLYQNFPNPFNPVTVVRYALPVESDVLMSVYDVIGRLVKVILDSRMPAGTHETLFRADDLPSGTYLLNVKVGKQTQTLKLLLIK
jgi:hypothetical protein